MSEHPYALGWDHTLEPAAKAALLKTSLYQGVFSVADDRPLPKAFSLSRFHLWPWNQGPAGTCFAHGPTHLFQIATAASGLWVPVPLSRRFVARKGKDLDGGGNPTNGGSVTNAMRSMSDPPQGFGVCHDEKFPYTTNTRELAQEPPADAVGDAALDTVHLIADLPYDPENWKRSIFNGFPIAEGTWWSFNGDNANELGQVIEVGRGTFGHAYDTIGWIDARDGGFGKAWDGHLWWQKANSHGRIYSPLPADIAALVVGYKPETPDRDGTFWGREDWTTKVRSYGSAEALTAAGLTGFVKQEHPSTFEDAFPPIW